MSVSLESTLPPDDQTARRNALVLSFASALGGANASILIATAGLVGQSLAPDPTLATTPVTTFVLGTALTAIPAALLMKNLGRRNGLMFGALIGVAAALAAALSIRLGSFLLLCFAAMLAGSYGAFVQQYRFAATDFASESFRPRAISWVLAGGVLAGVIGPQTVIHTAELLPPFTFMASYFAQAALALVSIGVLALLREPPARKHANDPTPARPLRVIARNPLFFVAVLCAAASYVVMNFVMTATPLAMVGCGHATADAVLAIQWHVIAMFAPSFVTGRLIARFGAFGVMAAGFLLLLVSGATALSGLSLAHFFLTLIFLGVGWNFSFIGATSLLGETHRPSERGAVQAANDFVVFGSVAVGSLSAGAAFASAGWTAVNLVVFPAALLCLASIAITAIRGESRVRP